MALQRSTSLPRRKKQMVPGQERIAPATDTTNHSPEGVTDGHRQTASAGDPVLLRGYCWYAVARLGSGTAAGFLRQGRRAGTGDPECPVRNAGPDCTLSNADAAGAVPASPRKAPPQ